MPRPIERSPNLEREYDLPHVHIMWLPRQQYHDLLRVGEPPARVPFPPEMPQVQHDAPMRVAETVEEMASREPADARAQYRLPQAIELEYVRQPRAAFQATPPTADV